MIAFAAALVALRLAGALAARWRVSRQPELLVWSAALAAYALAAAALAWGAAHGWDGRAFRVYYLFGGLETAPLLGAGALLLVGRRSALPVVLVYAGLAVGVAVAAPLHGVFVESGGAVPAAQDHLAFLPARLLAIVANTVGTAAVVGVALATIRRRPLANLSLLAGVAVAATGSALGSLGSGGAAATIGAGAALLYAGFAGPSLARGRFPLRSDRARL
jgi:hypothetical protein